MSNRNDITGDKLITKTLSKEGQANWDTIFPPKKKEPIKLTQHEYNNIETIEALIDSHNKKKVNDI